MRSCSIIVAAAIVAALSSSACAQEVFGGLYAHDVNWVTASGVESGSDVQFGWRGERMRTLRALGAPSPHVFAAVNGAGDTSFLSGGFSWKIGGVVFVRPGIGLAVHTGPDHYELGSRRIWFGSRVLFEPEIGVGVNLSDRASVEASWVHLSHAMLFNRENPGIDTIGIRLNYRLRR